jgi:S-adenosylmethionine hydrolase
MSSVITFTTDFGQTDGYVAAMKGVVLGINPEAVLVDICHAINPQDISQAAFILSTVHEYFPKSTIHLVVVDPGVGTERRAIILRTRHADFVAPDNGVLSYIIRYYSGGQSGSGRYRLEPNGSLEAIAITRPEFWRMSVSATFHGRDIFAPVAARLSLGTPLSHFGEPVDSLVVLPAASPEELTDGTLAGHILHIDNFGNLITDIKSSDLPKEDRELTVEVGGQSIKGISRTYGAGGGLLALIGSSGYLEIALPDGNASSFLNASAGDKVVIRQPRQ